MTALTKRLPLFWLVVVTIVIASIIPIVLVATTDSFIIGMAVLIAITIVVSFVLSKTATGKIVQLTTITEKIDSALVNDTIQNNFSDLIPQGNFAELDNFTDSLRKTLGTLDRQLAQVNSLYAISQTITSNTLDYEKTVKAVLAAVQKVVDYDAAEVSVLRGDKLVVDAWWGKDGFTDTTGRRYRIGSGPTGSIAETKQILYLRTVSDSTQDLQRTIGYASAENEFMMKTTKLVINSFLGIPLLIKDRLIGTLTMVHHEPAFFTPDDKRQLNKLADQASIAIDNALKIREREERLQNQIAELQLAIDNENRHNQVSEITESDYFQQLKTNAKQLRDRAQERTQQLNFQPPPPKIEPDQSTD